MIAFLLYINRFISPSNQTESSF